MSIIEFYKLFRKIKTVTFKILANLFLTLIYLHLFNSVAAQQTSPSPKLEQVIIVFKTHFDIGYTDMASNVVERYRTKMIDDALKVVDLSRNLPPEQQFVWTLPGFPMTKILEDHISQTKERKQRIIDALKEGRFVIHSLPFTLHTELLEPEDLARGLEFSTEISRSLSLQLPRDAKMTDVPCHSFILPPLLTSAGVDFLHIGCNAASSSPKLPRLFWWINGRGKPLLTMYTAESYGTGIVPPPDWNYKNWLALIHTGDNHGPPTPDEVKNILSEATKKLPGVKIRIGRLSDFADAILAEKPDLPVGRGDMPDTWIHGPMSDPEGAKIARNIRPLISVTEGLITQMQLWGIETNDFSSKIQKAYALSLLYGEHTWGGALYWITKYSKPVDFHYGDLWKKERQQGRFKRLEDSWHEHSAYIHSAKEIIEPLLQEELQKLAAAMPVSGGKIVVYNPLGWRRDGIVSIRSTVAKFSGVKAFGSSFVEPVQWDGDTAKFLARDIPPMGYRCYIPIVDSKSPSIGSRPRSQLKDTKTLKIENRFYSITVDPKNGGIASLYDKTAGRELVDATSRYGFGTVLYERFDSNIVANYVKSYVKINADWALNELGKPNLPPTNVISYRAIMPANFSYEVYHGPIAKTIILNSGKNPDLPFSVSTRIDLYNNQPFIDLEVTVYNKPADPFPEGGWICFNFNMKNPQFLLGRQASVINPIKDIVAGANKHLIGINTAVAVVDETNYGFVICPLDSPLVSCGEPGLWKYSLDYVPSKPAVFINLFNNQWTTNFRMWNEGTWKYRVRLWSSKNFDDREHLIPPSLESRYPLVAAYAEGLAGSLKPAMKGIEVSNSYKTILITAFASNPFGKGKILRVWEYSGRPCLCKITLPDYLNVKIARKTNLRLQDTGKQFPLIDNSFWASLLSSEPGTFILE